jgi:FMN phosphatase YigB (HAD superfamily)
MTPETVSYDVFDTVVTRNFAHPRDLFVHVGTLAHQRKLLPVDGLAFAQARWAAELAARKQSPWTEVLLDDIYRVLAGHLGWDAATTDAVKSLELATEERHLRGIARTRAVLAGDRVRAGRLLFLSDMYLPAPILRAWLEREDMAAPGDAVFVSGEVRGNKSSGALFEHARRETGGDFRRWQHTGDHPFADVAKPRSLGIKARHFTDAHLTSRERTVRGTGGEFAPAWRSLLAGAMRLTRLDHTPVTDRESVLWEIGANVAGPLFDGFVRWTLAEAERRGIRRLYFLARDGQIFWRVAQTLSSKKAGAIECRYLYASRLAFAGPYELENPAALRILTAPTGHFHSLRQALQQFGLTTDWARAELPTGLAELEPDQNLPQAAREQLADWLLAPAQRATLQAATDRRIEEARAYLAQEGVRAGESVGLVDAGWLGSIQRNLEHILGEPGHPTPLTGFYLGLMPPQPPGPMGEMIGYANAFAPLPLQREESHKVLVELMAQSDHGQVAGFARTATGWVPRLLDAGPVNAAEIQFFQNAVLAFARRRQDTIDETEIPWAEYHRTVLGVYHRFHNEPAAHEVRVFGFLPHADQVFEQQHATLCADAGLGKILAMIFDYRKRPPHWWVGGQAALRHGLFPRLFRWLKRTRWRLAGNAS